MRLEKFGIFGPKYSQFEHVTEAKGIYHRIFSTIQQQTNDSTTSIDIQETRCAAPLLNDAAEADPVLKESPVDHALVESADGLPNRRLELIEVLGLHGVDHGLQVAPEEEVAWSEVRPAGRLSKRLFCLFHSGRYNWRIEVIYTPKKCILF